MPARCTQKTLDYEDRLQHDTDRPRCRKDKTTCTSITDTDSHSSELLVWVLTAAICHLLFSRDEVLKLIAHKGVLVVVVLHQQRYEISSNFET